MRKAVWVFGLFCFLFPVAMAAQNAAGTLRGVVQDQTGARIVAAKITLALKSSAAMRIGATDERGEFRFDDLTPGSWTVKVIAKGFDEAAASVDVVVSAVRD